MTYAALGTGVHRNRSQEGRGSAHDGGEGQELHDLAERRGCLDLSWFIDYASKK